MVVDSSAVTAILLGESDGPRFAEALSTARRPMLSAANYVEICIVQIRKSAGTALQEVDELIGSAGIEIVPVTADHAQRAREAYRRYGKGNHKAGLNFGDCFAFALAEATGEPLLYKGNDFPVTGIPAVDFPAP